MTTRRLLPTIGLIWSFCSLPLTHGADPPAAFPLDRPKGGSFSRPADGELLNVSPPGFSWWRAARAGDANYRLKIVDEDGVEAYRSSPSPDPVSVPTKVLPAGKYSWTVDALDQGGSVLDTTDVKHFEIAEDAIAQPWVPAEKLLARVSRQHPRLLFPQEQLDEIRSTLDSTRREAFESLRRAAGSGLKLTPPMEPDYDEIKDPAERRLAYRASYSTLRRYHLGAMQHTALMYLMSGEKQYGETAKALLLDAAQWDPEGISSVLAPYGDEVGLGLVKSEALTYDWIYDLLSDEERAQAEAMLIARADQMLRRLQRRDFLSRPESSHDGRLPGFLLEHAMVLAEHPRASVWMDYALKSILTVFPHWAGRDGGWAEGISYGMAYNTMFITPLESLRIATGFDVWQRSFYGKLPYFFFYNVSPRGEIAGFGDSYDKSVSSRAVSIRSLIQFHAERTGDRKLRWWVDLLRDRDGGQPSLSPIIGLIYPQSVQPLAPVQASPDAVFRGVGWAALHSQLDRPDQDLFVAFKSSPYGGVSHSYADQNGFAILKGGLCLARPGGTRYPQHGTPFHTQYTQQTLAQNGILVDGKGQVNRDARAGGHIVAFKSTPHIGYVCGDATAAYGNRLTRFRRHVILVRPSLICIVDDLVSTKPVQFQWLMHGFEQLRLDQSGQTLVSQRGAAEMKVHVITPGGFEFSQTDQWPMDPKTGYPTAKQAEPEKLWHFTAETRGKASSRRIAAVMTVGSNGERPACDIQFHDPVVLVQTKADDVKSFVEIDLSTDRAELPLLNVRCEPNHRDIETLLVE